tara:strand:+ start:2252 stop:2905 length:654 start_codon:yes stop_codon:yes gene_type:complete
MKNFTLNSASELGRLENVITGGESKIAGTKAEVSNAIMESYLLVMTDMVCNGIYPSKPKDTQVKWPAGIGKERGKGDGQLIEALMEAGVQSKPSIKRLSEGSAKVMHKLLKEFKAIPKAVDPADQNAVFGEVSKLMAEKNLQTQSQIAKFVAPVKEPVDPLDELVEAVAKLNDADRITFDRKLAEALKSKAEAEEAQRKAEAEAKVCNNTVKDMLDA